MSPFLVFMIPIVAIVSVSVVTITLPLVRAYARKVEMDGQQPRGLAEVAARLERMEQAIDAVAVEVERIAEAQRFTTKLLAGSAGAGPSDRSADRPWALAAATTTAGEVGSRGMGGNDAR